MRARIRLSRIRAPRALKYSNLARRRSRRNPGSPLLTYTSRGVLRNEAIAIRALSAFGLSPAGDCDYAGRSQVWGAGQPFWLLPCAIAARRRAASLRAF